jgi:hypothetical protein
MPQAQGATGEFWFAVGSLVLLSSLYAVHRLVRPMSGGWSARRLTMVPYSFGTGTVAVDRFVLSLILSWVGLPVLSPVQSVIGGSIIGVPASFAFARQIRRPMDGIDGR